MTIAKPCAAVWTGSQPANPHYRFDLDRGVQRLLANPELYDEVLLDIGRFIGDREYQFVWLERMSNQTLGSLIATTVRFTLLGKAVTWYMGGVHNDPGDPAKGHEPVMEDDRWCELYSRRRARAELHRIFDRFTFNMPGVSWCMDGMAGGDTEKSRAVRAHIVHDVAEMGFVHTLKIEGFAPPGRTISHFPSMSTGAQIANTPLPDDYNPADHAIIMQSDHGKELIPHYRRRGCKVFLGSPIFVPGMVLPDWWGGDLEDAPGGQTPAEPKPADPVTT